METSINATTIKLLELKNDLLDFDYKGVVRILRNEEALIRMEVNLKKKNIDENDTEEFEDITSNMFCFFRELNNLDNIQDISIKKRFYRFVGIYEEYIELYKTIC